jgi:DNA-binding NarL/FixJ family response regulator
VPLQCLIVDDSAIMRDAARTVLQREGISVVGVASTSAEALRLVSELQPDVALIDIELGEESGLDLADRLAELGHVRTVSILISVYPAADFAELIEVNAAAAFMPKDDLSAKTIHSILEDSRES